MMNAPIFRKQQRSSSPKVISVPVQFISSDQSQTKALISNDSAARKIQNLFRSFLVRKCVKKINSIRTEVSEIERRINDIETVNLIHNDPKEQLRVNETLMSLLFKLDSIRCIDSSVRDFRKTVTKKAIALQEKVDSIGQSETVKEVVENCDSVKVASDQATEPVENDEVVKEVVENCNFVEAVEGSMEKLEKLKDDNEKMMKLMMQISERNEMQTRMINSLSRRVEHLEKGQKRKKKTHGGLRRHRDDFYI